MEFIDVRLTVREAEVLLRALERMEGFDVVFDKAALNRAKIKIDMALNNENLSAD